MLDLMAEDELPAEAQSEAVEAMAFILSLRALGMRDTAVLGAMERVPRDLFAPRRYRDLARNDIALPLPCGQSMTAPGVVATMLSALKVTPACRVLEVGTGSGYVTALLARLGCGRVTSVERYATLAAEAAARFRVAGLVPDAVTLLVGDGCALEEAGARFDRILVNGATPEPPEGLARLLTPGGRLVGAVTGDPLSVLAVCERHAVTGEIACRIEGGALRLGRLAAGAAAAL